MRRSWVFAGAEGIDLIDEQQARGMRAGLLERGLHRAQNLAKMAELSLARLRQNGLPGGLLGRYALGMHVRRAR